MPSLERKYWLSLEELRGAVQEPGEFLEGQSELDGQSRRDFLKLLGLAGAGAGMAGCFSNPPEAVLPYVRAPENIQPGNPLHYATTLTLDGYGTGVVVTSWEGRPTKVEGNADHPASLGGSGVYEQAAVYHLYDPQRARELKHRGKPQAFRQYLAKTEARLSELAKDRGARLRFLVEPTGSPLDAWLRKQILAQYPEAKFYAFSPLSEEARYEGARRAFGRPLETTYALDKARAIVSLDANFLAEGPFNLRYAREFAAHRVPEEGLNRLWVAEPGFTVTGASADHRLRVKAGEIHALALALLHEIAPDRAPANNFSSQKWVQIAAKDLKARGAQALVIAGRRQPAPVHAIAAAINATLGSACVRYTEPVLSDVSNDLRPLCEEIKAGKVDTLVVTAYNPVYTAPRDLNLAELFRKTPNLIYRGLFEDETARHCHWFVPAKHDLESWGDARAADGTVSLMQPLIVPLWNGISTAELLSPFCGLAGQTDFALLKRSWSERKPALDFEGWWNIAVQKGIVDDTALPEVKASLAWDGLKDSLSTVASGGMEIAFRADPRVHDGRFADCAWLQETPEPLTKLCWSNALELSPATAQKLGLENGQMATVTVAGHTLEAAAILLPGHADDAASLTLGYGRSGAEMIARELGYDAGTLRTAAQPWFASATISKSEGTRLLSLTQDHWSMEDKPIALEVTADDVKKKHLPIVEEQKGPQPTVFPEHQYPGFKWGMAIDMSKCIGCNACMMACNSENNILIVGAEQVRKRRAMHWIRVDRYFAGDEHDPEAVMQPMACVHCEMAPCEYVCPVNATVHSDEGLNEMVYNRCVGTRYCSNNCPYKVRRFNWLNWHKNLQGTEMMAMNPDVTVRSRGVMEKCTYCVQRIERWRISERIQGKGEPADWKDQSFTTACAQACPANAIVFGSLHDKTSLVAKAQEDERAYQVLHELNTRPRTFHLARVRNRHPEMS